MATALLGAVALLLLIACANVTGLMLARCSARGTELGIRMALGAARAQVLRKVLSGGLLLVAIGLALGFGARLWGDGAPFEHSLRRQRQRRPDVHRGKRPAGTGHAGGPFIPARRAASIDPMDVLRADLRHAVLELVICFDERTSASLAPSL